MLQISFFLISKNSETVYLCIIRPSFMPFNFRSKQENAKEPVKNLCLN